MQNNDGRITEHPLTVRWLHWLTLPLVLAQFVLAWVATSRSTPLPPAPSGCCNGILIWEC